MSRRSSGATYSGGRSYTMGARTWQRARLAQTQFKAQAYAEGLADAHAGRAPQINRCADYYLGVAAASPKCCCTLVPRVPRSHLLRLVRDVA